MDASFFLFGMASVLAPFAMVLETLLAMRRQTRYFAIPLVLGAIVALAASAMHAPQPGTFRVLLGAFGLVAIPVGLLCAAIAIMGAADRRTRHGVRNFFAVLFAAILLLTLVHHADRPNGAPTAQVSGAVRGISVAGNADGSTRQVLEVELADGSKVRAEGGTFVPLDATRVRLNERRSVLTRSRSYEVAGVEE